MDYLTDSRASTHRSKRGVSLGARRTIAASLDPRISRVGSYMLGWLLTRSSSNRAGSRIAPASGRRASHSAISDLDRPGHGLPTSPTAAGVINALVDERSRGIDCTLYEGARNRRSRSGRRDTSGGSRCVPRGVAILDGFRGDTEPEASGSSSRAYQRGSAGTTLACSNPTTRSCASVRITRGARALRARQWNAPMPSAAPRS